MNLVAHHISKRMELMRDQQKQTECETEIVGKPVQNRSRTAKGGI